MGKLGNSQEEFRESGESPKSGESGESGSVLRGGHARVAIVTGANKGIGYYM